MKAQIFVTLKREVLDPQGDAVRRALNTMDLGVVRDVRVGKLIEIEIDEPDAEAASRALTAMCDQLLANPVIEDYRVEVVEAS